MSAKLEFMVKVNNNEVVAAILPVEEQLLPHSNLDLLLPAVDVGVFFCYKKPKAAGNNYTFLSIISILKKALAHNLAYYYPFAAKMRQSADGEPQLLCNNRGVDFIEAFADVELKDLNFYNPHENVDGKLVPKRKQGVLAIQVSNNEVVAAIFPVQEHLLPLSNLDLLLPAVDVGVFFCYKKPKAAGNNYTFLSIISILKKALAHTLAYYYPFAAEMRQNADGEPQLLCNNRGVDFIEAFADVELKDLNFYNPHENVDGKLAPKRKQGVLAIQATQFKCGGFVVFCTFDHRVADAYSANMFLVSWAEMARSKPPSQLPSFQRSLLFPWRPGFYDVSVINTYVPTSSVLFDSKKSQPEVNDLDQVTISRIYYMKANQIIKLQSLANSDSTNPECMKTKLVAFSAFLWKKIAEGKYASNYGKNCRMGIVVDGRRRLINGDENKAKKWAAYFGNVLSIPSGEMKIDELKKKPINEVANAIHEFLQPSLTREHFLGLVDWVEAHRPTQMLAKMYAANVTKEEPAIVVSSGLHFPVRKMDFGWGKPAFGSYHFPWGGQAGYVMPLPSPIGNGDWVVYMHLLKDQLEWIETCAADVFKPLTSHFLNMHTN